jgi:hypothetical protein
MNTETRGQESPDLYLNNALITYQSKLQSSFALSTMEAETNSGCSAAQYLVAARNFMEEMGFKQEEPTTLFEDNSSCIYTNLPGRNIRERDIMK